MSNGLAIAAVTAVLRDLLTNGLIDHAPPGMGDVKVTALPPDRIATGQQEQSQLNLFLYHVTPNPGWRNASLPSRDSRGQRLTNPPLALDLHYLLTAYGAKDFHPEILLGYGMQLLHETPALGRDAIRTALAAPSPVNGGGSLPAGLRELSTSGLAEQIEQIKITLQSLNTDEMSKLWTALQAHYRPTSAYLITVVLIEATKPTRSPLPVLARGPADQGVMAQPDLTPPFPTLAAATPPNQQSSLQLGDTLTLEGHHLEGTNLAVRFTNPRLSAPITLPPLAGNTATRLQVTIPNAPAQWVAGLYTVAVILRRPGETFERATNELPLALAPRVTSPMPMSVTLSPGGDATLTLTCAPEVRPTQIVSLVLGDIETPAGSHPTQTATLDFLFKQIPPGEYWVRLRVDGVDSQLVNHAVSPPVFFNNQKVTITP